MTDSTPARKPSLGVLAQMFRFVRPYRWRVFGATLALIFTAGITLSIGQGIRILVDEGFRGAGGVQALDRSLLLFGGLVFLLGIGTYCRYYLVSWIGERVCADLRTAVFDHIVGLHPGFFEAVVSSDIQSTITTDTSLLQTVIGSSASLALRNTLILIGGIVLMAISNLKLTLMVMICVPLVVFPILLFGRRVRALSRVSQDRLAEVGTYVSEAIKNIKVVQAFNHQGHDRDRFRAHVETAFNAAIGRIGQRAWLTALVIMLVFGAVDAMVWVGGNDVLSGVVSAGALTAFVFYAVMVAGSVGAISEVYGDLQRAAGASERLFELLNAKSLIAVPAQPKTLPAAVRGEVVLRDVVFAYPSRADTLAIDHLSLVIPAGKTTALVGASGAGKSTLIDLLLRFYDIQGGSIEFDGIDIRELDPARLRDHIALVPQQPVLFTGSVRDNLRYGRDDANDTDIEAAAKAAFAHEFIIKLPQGYDSFVGEGGVRLSGGQRQRIAIARALLKDPELLLLDEATSALDAESEFQVQQALEILMRNRTSLVIAHRLATVIKADNIVVLDHGRLIAQGQHHELLVTSPLYARWASLQFDSQSLGTQSLGTPSLGADEVHSDVVDSSTSLVHTQ